MKFYIEWYMIVEVLFWLGQNIILQKSEKVGFLIENHDIFGSDLTLI